MTVPAARVALPLIRVAAPSGGVVAADRGAPRVARFGILVGPDGWAWSWSPDMSGMLGVADDGEAGADSLVDALHPDDRSPFRRMLGLAIERRQPFCHQSRLARRDGLVRLIEASGSVWPSPDGASSRVVGRVGLIADWSLPALPIPGGTLSEGDMAVALLARAETAHRYAFVRYASLVRRVALRHLRDPTQVDDVVQAVFETLWVHPERFDSTRGSLAAYLQVQARSRSLDLLRSEASRRSRVHRFVDANRPACPDPAAASPDIGGPDVRTALDLLPAKERDPIELAYFGAMSYRQVAAHLGLPEGTVKSRIRSGLARLRQLDGMGHFDHGTAP